MSVTHVIKLTSVCVCVCDSGSRLELLNLDFNDIKDVPQVRTQKVIVVIIKYIYIYLYIVF